jgi:oligopeptide transport system permease protein
MDYNYEKFEIDDFALVGLKGTEEQADKNSIPYFSLIFKRFTSNKWAVTSFFIIVFIGLFAIFAPIMSPFNATAVHPEIANLSPRVPILERLGIFNGYPDSVSKQYHLFGTDGLGRDIFVRVAVGTRISLFIAIAAMFLDLLIGVIYGLISGYYGGKVDLVMQRITEILSILPTIIVVSLLLIVLRPGLQSIIVAMMLTGWINMSRIIRAQVFKVKEQEYIMAARTLGQSTLSIVFKEILPNSSGQVITTFMFSIPNAIFLEAFLAFIGLGVPEPYASLGSMINDGYESAMVYPHIIVFPIILLILLMLSFNIFADGWRDAIDPDLKGK